MIKQISGDLAPIVLSRCGKNRICEQICCHALIRRTQILKVMYLGCIIMIMMFIRASYDGGGVGLQRLSCKSQFVVVEYSHELPIEHEKYDMDAPIHILRVYFSKD